MTKTRIVQAGCPVIIGAGLAGLTAAIELSPLPCVVLSAGAVSTGTSTGWAQGGVAAAVGPDDDPELHALETMTNQVSVPDDVADRARLSVERMLAVGK